MLLVLNEWVFHDLLGENGETRRRETVRFLSRLRQSDDAFVIPAETGWKQKAFRLMTMSDRAGITISKLFHNLMLNTDKVVIQPEDAQPIPDDLPDIPDEDVYLVRAYRATGADLLVTTDAELFDALSRIDAVNCRMRANFCLPIRLAPAKAGPVASGNGRDPAPLRFADGRRTAPPAPRLPAAAGTPP